MLNMEFDRPVVVRTADMQWEASPMGGVWRKPLAREAAEHGHTTSVVRYDEGSRFSAHLHPKGEEILVLEGVFSDEHGDYAAGTYLRNPPGSRHSPFSEPGCVLLVKLDQFDSDDDVLLRVDSRSGAWHEAGDGVQVMPLHQHGSENVELQQYAAGRACLTHRPDAGEELFVVSGRLTDGEQQYAAGSWLRLPPDSELQLRADEATLLWAKSGHLLP